MPLTLLPRASLRRRVLLLFGALAIVPLIILGALDYAKARRVVERIIVVQNDTAAARAARLIGDRYGLIQSDALLLGNGAETQALFVAIAQRDSARIRPALARADAFASSVWTRAAAYYNSIELHDGRGALVYRLTADSFTRSGVGAAPGPMVAEPVLAVGTRRSLGRLVFDPRAETLLPAELANLPVGKSGELLVIDRESGVVAYDSRGQRVGIAAATELHGATASGVGNIRYAAGDSERLASLVQLVNPPWTILTSTATREFTDGLGGTRALDVAVVLLTAAAMILVFGFFIGRTTRSLEELTQAVRVVETGNLNPRLPAPGGDEVGTLSGAFDSMLQRLRSMMQEIEVSRQLAVVGEFAAQLSHEIRNPLTSIKLNLQAIKREVQRGTVNVRATQPLEISLREVNRLDTVVRGVLELARPRPRERTFCSVHVMLRRVVELLDSEIQDAGLVVSMTLSAERDGVQGDGEQLVGLFMNLLLNAVEALRGGIARDGSAVGDRRIHITSANGVDAHVATIEIVFADTGPGVKPELRDRIFHPFVSGKSTGTGLGLSIALRTAREHGGSLELSSTPPGGSGAAFVVVLPVSFPPNP